MDSKIRRNTRNSAATLNNRTDASNLSSGMHITMLNPTTTSNQAKANALNESKQQRVKSKEQLLSVTKPLVVVPPPIPAAMDNNSSINTSGL